MNIKEDTVFRCGIDGKPFKLVLGKHSLYYRCPNYELAERGAGNKVCMNRMSLKDVNMLCDELEKMQKENRLAVGEGGKRIHLLYEIEEIDEDYLSVYVINTHKIKIESGEYE